MQTPALRDPTSSPSPEGLLGGPGDFPIVAGEKNVTERNQRVGGRIDSLQVG